MIYRFGQCELDSDVYELYREGKKVEIERRVFDVLLYLLENRGRLITREELLDNCWPGMYISDGTLTTSLGRVRRAVGQGKQKHQQIIETVHGKGYRFLADVTEHPGSSASKATPAVTPAPETSATETLPNAETNTETALIAEVEASQLSAPDTSVAPDQPKQTGAEVRQLTVVNCTLCDIQALLARYDAEEVHNIIRTFYLTASDVISRFEGYLAHQQQDTMQVYFGYPVAHEDDARRAIRSALQLLTESALQHFNVAIGIHSGPVIIDQTLALASSAPITLGLTPAVAEQLCRRAATEPPAIIISETTAQLSAGHFDWRTLEPVPLAGQAEAMRCYQVSTDKQQTRLQVSEALHGLTPYTGRSTEQALLLERWMQACDGHGQTVLISGDAGIGKSRLLQNLQQHSDIDSPRWLECYCSPYHQNTPFYPLINLLVQLLQWHPEDNAEQRLHKLEAFLDAYQLPLDSAVPLFADLLSLKIPAQRYPLIEQNAQPERQQLQEYLVTLLLDLQQQADEPLLLVIEDLHWIDPSTLEFVDLLTTQIATLPMLLVLTARPEFKAAWSVAELVTPLAITRFNSKQIEQMLLGITEGKELPDSVLTLIVEKTDGVPLFIEEIAHNLLESAQLQETADTFELNSPPDSLSVPLTLQDSLMARLDRLGEAREVARWGAVIGREFSYRLLAIAAPFSESILQQHLNELLSSGLVHRRGLAQRASYLFKHALVQDITYQSLLKRQRKEFHQRIAEVLENAFPETVTRQPELLARHYEAAEQFQSALHFWHQAGDKAVQSSALQEALTHFSKALALLQKLPASEASLRRELALQISLGPLWVALKGQAAEEVEKAYRRADELCLRLGEHRQRFAILWGLWRWHNNRADLSTARDIARQLLELAQQQEENSNKSSLLLEAHLANVNTDLTLADFSSAHQHIEQALSLYDQEQHRSLATLFGGWEPGVYSLLLAALTHWLRGNPARALQSDQQALALARQIAEPYTLVSALNYCCFNHVFFRHIDTVKKLADESITLAGEHGIPSRLAIGKMFLGWSLTLQDNESEGMALMQEGLATHASTGNVLGRPVWHYILVDAYVETQHYDEALTLLAETFALIEQTKERQLLAELYRFQGECFHGQDDHQQAEDSFSQALQIAREQQAKLLELRATMSLARLWRQQNKAEDARNLLKPVFDGFSEDNDAMYLRQAGALLEQLSG